MSYRTIESTIDSQANVLVRGDRIETIYKDFIRKEYVGLKGVVIDIESYDDHWSCVDSRGEDCGTSFIDVVYKMDDGVVVRTQNIYVIKINKI